MQCQSLKHKISLHNIYINLLKVKGVGYPIVTKPGLCQPWGLSMWCSEQIVSGWQSVGISHKLVADLAMYGHNAHAICLF